LKTKLSRCNWIIWEISRYKIIGLCF